MNPMYVIDKFGMLVGTCTHSIAGWRFLPNVYSRKASRKAWPSATACIPKWAFDLSDDLLTLEEWKQR